MKYDFSAIEKKWQDKWYKEKSFKALFRSTDNAFFRWDNCVYRTLLVWTKGNYVCDNCNCTYNQGDRYCS